MSLGALLSKWPLVRQIREGKGGTGLEAMSDKTRAMHARIDGGEVARSVCPYCGVGCGQLIFHNLCPKGAASYQLLTHSRGETKVKYRAARSKDWQEIPLERAMDMVADRVWESRKRTFVHKIDNHTISGPAILLAMDSKAKQLGKYEGGKVWFISGVLRGVGRELASRFLKQQKPMFVLASLIISTLITTSTLMAQKAVASPLVQETITELMSKDLAGFPDKEVLMYTVDFPPGFSSPIHRHEAQVFVYVLEGSVVMQVRGGEEVTLQPGQTFYEDPKDVHVVSRNASSTKPAKFLVFLIHKKGTPLVMPAT